MNQMREEFETWIISMQMMSLSVIASQQRRMFLRYGKRVGKKPELCSVLRFPKEMNIQKYLMEQ